MSTASLILTVVVLTMTLTFINGQTSDALLCNFDNGQSGRTDLACLCDGTPCSLEQDAQNAINWMLWTGGTPSNPTGPNADHTTGSGLYIYTEATFKNPGDKATLRTPTLTLGQPSCITLWYHMFGVHIGSLEVWAASPSGNTMLWSKTGQQGEEWLKAAIGLGADVTQVTIVASRGGTRRTEPYGDLGLDDITITRQACEGGSGATPSPTAAPTAAPTPAPTPAPTAAPTAAPTTAPTPAPTAAPTAAPTPAPTPAPTAAPTAASTPAPTPAPTPPTTMEGSDMDGGSGDSSPRHRVEACEGKTVELTCPRGYEVRIQSASWGLGDASSCNANNGNGNNGTNGNGNGNNGTNGNGNGNGNGNNGTNGNGNGNGNGNNGTNGNGNGMGEPCSLPEGKAAELVEGLCQGRRECRVSATFAFLGNPCIDPINKQLTVDYTCQQTLYKTRMCSNSGQLPMACPGNKLIQTQGAFYGRDDINTTCPDQYDDHVLCSSEAATQIVEELCDGKNECELDAIARIFGAPCPSSYLRVNYTCAECSNAFGDDALCEYWALLGDCSTDPDWMHTNCRKACSKCDDSIRCVNAHFNDTECEGWAFNGQCESNPAYMYAFCKKSCLQCDKPTPCGNNRYDDYYAVSECQGYYDDGVCWENSGFALPQCTRSCFQCAENENLKCENRHSDTALCEQFALEGECVSNPGWMYPNCLKACTGCDRDPVCRNEVSDSLCQGWFETGECATNPTYMYRFCWKTCMQCEGPPACANLHTSDDDCEFWTMMGFCDTNPTWMTTNCQASCTRCGVTPLQNCLNEGANDTMCDEWANMGDCQTNPTWMLPNCRKSCTWCDYVSSSLLKVGNSAVPGEASNFTRARSVILPNAVPVNARLNHFSVFFATRDPVWLQVWAKDVTSGAWYTVYNTRVVPDAAMSAQTVMVQGCTPLFPGDRVGFTSPGGVASIGHTLQPDGAFQPTLIRRASSTTAFDSMGLPYAFSLSLGYDDGNLC